MTLEGSLLGLIIFLMQNLKCVVFNHTCVKQKQWQHNACKFWLMSVSPAGPLRTYTSFSIASMDVIKSPGEWDHNGATVTLQQNAGWEAAPLSSSADLCSFLCQTAEMQLLVSLRLEVTRGELYQPCSVLSFGSRPQVLFLYLCLAFNRSAPHVFHEAW